MSVLETRQRSFVTAGSRRCWISRTTVYPLSSGIGAARSSKSSERWPISQLRVICDAECSSQGSGIQVDRTGGRYSTQAWRTGRTCTNNPSFFFAARRQASRDRSADGECEVRFRANSGQTPQARNPANENRTTLTRKPNVWKPSQVTSLKSPQVKMQSMHQDMD